ncbi:hypothetical protein NUW58_g689 [Xylaria curta]|uniref:Uncharacterized protein n=1 Tax=Xylaria curta TaxID=42375 RepID=A0ACC1PQA9_9PEZI|nr:hypothetical protein NUW58_g689 [Xylaria curta]
MTKSNIHPKLTGDAQPEGSLSQPNIQPDSDKVCNVEPTLENYASIMATNKPDPRGPGYIRLYLLAATIFLCSTMSGFDSSLMGSINALPNYTEYFGLPASGNASTGIVFAIFQVGQIGAALFAWMTDWYGRIWHIFFGCLGVVIGTIVTGLATNLPTFIGGRFLLSFFATLTTTAAPLYLVEISPAAYRGTIAGAFNTFYYVGSILATSSVYGCHKYLADQGDLDWRIPIWLQAVCAGLVLFVIKFFPESPRYLILIDKHEEAREIITKYHANGDPDHPLVELEMKEMVQSVQGIPKATWKDLLDMRVLVETRSSRYRLMLNMVFSWFAQFSGNNIISYYLPVMLDAIGVTNTDTKLVTIGWVFATCGARLHDVVGRRKVCDLHDPLNTPSIKAQSIDLVLDDVFLLFHASLRSQNKLVVFLRRYLLKIAQMLMGSTFGMSICLALVAAGAAGKIEYNNNAAATLSIVFIFAFGATYSGAFTPMQPVYPAEVVSNRMRAKAMGAYKLTAGAAGFLNTFVTPIALSSIGYWFYVFFAFWDTFEFAFIYFFFVETKNLTLEELDIIFEADNPRKASVDAKKKLQTMYKLSVEGAKTTTTMHPYIVTMLAFACGTVLGTPTLKHAPRIANLPLPSRTIFQLDDSVPGSWFENIAIRQNGDLLVTLLQPSASIYSIRRPLSDSPEISIISIENANGLLGIAETSPDIFAVVGGKFSSLAVPIPGTMAIWEINFRGPKPTTRLVAELPEAGSLNGIASLPSRSSPVILAADNGIEQVWRVDLKTSEYEMAAEVPEMKAVPNATLPLGVNGVKIRDGYLYFSNSNLASIFRLRIDENGVAVKGAEAELVAKFNAENIDDFVIDEKGNCWATTNFQNTVDVAQMGSPGKVVVGKSTELTVAGDTALALGRTKRDKNIVYVVTGGALGRPVNGTVTEPAKVVAIDRTEFK